MLSALGQYHIEVVAALDSEGPRDEVVLSCRFIRIDLDAVSYRSSDLSYCRRTGLCGTGLLRSLAVASSYASSKRYSGCSGRLL